MAVDAGESLGRNIVRVMVILWKDTSGISWSGILNATATEKINAPYNHGRRQQFKILFDRRYTLVDIASNEAKLFYANLKIPAAKMEFPSDVGNPRVYLYAVSDSTATPHPKFNGTAFGTFKDF